MAAFTTADHEAGLALFLRREHRPRFRESLGNEKLRRKLREKLAHFAWLDEQYVEAIPTREPEALAQMLRREGAPRACVLVAEDDELDGRELDLLDALRLVLHENYGALVSCVPGRLALYSEEAPNKTTLILRR